MADIDLLHARGIRGVAIVDANGVAVGGTKTVAQLSAAGMQTGVQVEATGIHSGGSTILQLLQRGLRPFCAVNGSGINVASGTDLLTLKQRGIWGACPVTALGVEQGGVTTIDQLRQRGISFFCPVNESGNETTLVGAAFTGPGDVVSGAIAWWGLRAYSDATKGGNLVRIRRVSDNAEQDFASLSTGALDRASIVTFLAASTGRVVTLYDQIGTKHVTQPTAGQQPVVNLSGIGSFVTADFTAASTHALTSGVAVSRVQPYTFGTVAKHTNIGSQAELFAESANLVFMGYRVSADNQVNIFNGGSFTATASDAAFHALTPVFTGAASNIYVDGTSNAVSAGVAPLGDLITLGGRGIIPFSGLLAEFGIWPSAFSGAQASSMSSNMHSYYGF